MTYAAAASEAERNAAEEYKHAIQPPRYDAETGKYQVVQKMYAPTFAVVSSFYSPHPISSLHYTGDESFEVVSKLFDTKYQELNPQCTSQAYRS